MRKFILLLFLGLLALTVSAQTMTKKPVFRPNWVFEAPRPGNGTYLYVVEHGEGNTKREALNQALGRVLQSTANRLGQIVSTDEINKAVQEGTDYEVISRKMKVPINKVCEFPVQDTITNSWTMYVLCQVAKAGNITPEFEATDECTKHTRYDEAIARWNKEQKDKEDAIASAKNARNTTALVASTFIPGTGQMLKGHGGSGAAFLIGELAIFGGGTVCHFLGEEQLKTMKLTKDYTEFQNAQNMKNTMDIAKWTCFGVGAAVHIGNMIHAWFVSDKKAPANFTFVPALIPTNEFATTEYAVGAGVQITF